MATALFKPPKKIRLFACAAWTTAAATSWASHAPAHHVCAARVDCKCQRCSRRLPQHPAAPHAEDVQRGNAVQLQAQQGSTRSRDSRTLGQSLRVEPPVALAAGRPVRRERCRLTTATAHHAPCRWKPQSIKAMTRVQYSGAVGWPSRAGPACCPSSQRQCPSTASPACAAQPVQPCLACRPPPAPPTTSPALRQQRPSRCCTPGCASPSHSPLVSGRRTDSSASPCASPALPTHPPLLPACQRGARAPRPLQPVQPGCALPQRRPGAAGQRRRRRQVHLRRGAAEVARSCRGRAAWWCRSDRTGTTSLRRRCCRWVEASWLR